MSAIPYDIHKNKVIQNTFPIKVHPKIITKKTKSKSIIPLKIISPKMTTYKINPNTSVKNDKVHLLLDYLSDSYQEIFQMFNQFKVTDRGIQVPSQNNVFFETKITNKKFENYITFQEEHTEEMMQTLNFTWYNASKNKINDSLFKLNKHCVIYNFKLKHTSGLSLSIDQRLKEKPLRELLEQSKILKNDEEIFIQFGIQPSEFDWYKEAERNMKNLSKRIKITETTHSKLSNPAFDCCLRVVVRGDNLRRSEMIARGTCIAFKQLNGDNELLEVRIKYKKMEKWFNKYIMNRKIPAHLLRFNKRFLLTRKEIKHFIKLPERNLQKEFEMNISERDELKIDPLLLSKNGVSIGHTKENGKNIEIKIPIDNLDTFCNTSIVCGSPRMGKDSYFCNYLVESVKKLNVGAFIPDVIDEEGNTRGMCDSLRDSLPKEKIIDLNLGNYDYPIYFGLEDVANLIGTNGMNVIADNFVTVLNLGDTTDSKELCSLIARVCKCNIYEMYCCLQSKIYANSIYDVLKEEDELLALEFYHEFLNAKRDKAISTVKTRLKMILGNPHFKHMMAQEPNKEIDFEKWIRERKVVLLRMKKMDIGDIGVQILMYLISMKIFWIKKTIQTDDPTFIVYNEPHQYMSDGLQSLTESMMTESPKYRLGIFWLFHSPTQLPTKLWSIMTSSSVNYFLFKNTSRKLYFDLSEQLKPIEIDTAMNTQKHEAIFLPFIDGKQLQPLFFKTLPPLHKRLILFDHSHLTKEHSELYGRNVLEVREKILEIELSMYNESKTA